MSNDVESRAVEGEGDRVDDPGGGLFEGLGTAAPVRRPRRERPSSGAVGIAVLVVLAVVCAGLIVAVVIKTRNDAAIAMREAASYTPPPSVPTDPAGAAVASIAVISDESAQRAASGVDAEGRWPRLLAGDLDADLDLQASARSGYASEGSSGRTFVEAASRVPADAGVVLFVGGAADGEAASLTLARSATEAFSAAAQQAPGADVIAVGPLYRPSGVSQDDFDALRTTLRSAARIAGIRWVDPVSDEWLDTVDATVDLSAADEREIADRLRRLTADAG